MAGLIVSTPSNLLSLYDGGDSMSDEEKLTKILEGIHTLERMLDENGDDKRNKRQMHRMLADMNKWLAETLKNIEEQQAYERYLNAGRDVNHVESETFVGVTGDGSFHSQQTAGRDLYYFDFSGNGGAQAQAPEDDSMSAAERDYLRWLLAKHSRVQLNTLNQHLAVHQNAPEISLNEIFVQLDIKHTQESIDREVSPEARAPVPVLDAINRRDVVVVLGDPGSGKTTLLNFLTFCLAGARLYPLDGRYLAQLSLPQRGGRSAVNWTHGALLPIRVNLRDFVQNLPSGTRRGTAKLLMEHITSQLKEHSFDDFAEEVRGALSEGQCIVMLDGLDEIGKPEHRQIVRDAISDFASARSDNKIVVTCRTLSYTNPDWQLHYKAVTLAPLDDDSIEEFIYKWYQALARRGTRSEEVARSKAQELSEVVTHLRDLARNPMLLTVMCVVHTYWSRLPRERARLYQDCIDLLLWTWTEPRLTPENGWEEGIVDRLGIRKERLIHGLSALAYTMHREQGRSTNAVDIPRSSVLEVLGDYLEGDEEKAAHFCDYVEQQAGLLVGRGQPSDSERTYAFPHRGFQEFLAARHVISDWDFAHLMVELAREGDIWHEVLLLATGHMVFNQEDIKRPLTALKALVKHTSPTDHEGWRTVWWAAEMLTIIERPYAEADQHIGKDVVPLLMAQLVQLVEEGHLSPVERVKAGDALGRLGDPRPGVCTLEPEMIRIDVSSKEEFQMGEGAERHRVRLVPFHIAKHAVTNAQFRVFLESSYEDDRFWTPDGREWRERASHWGGYIDDSVWGIDNRPVAGVSWYETVAYVRWLRHKTGKRYRLLTEAEWERAAAGLEQRRYPFGSRAGDDDVNTRESGVGQTAAVGIFPKDTTPEGVCDMGGNVWEWTSSLARPYPYKAKDGREDLEGLGARILRGGAYERYRSDMRCHVRVPAEPRAFVPLIGFRLAMDD